MFHDHRNATLRLTLKARAHILCRTSAHILTVDGKNLIAYLYARQIRGRALVGLCKDDIVATLTYQRANTAIASCGHQLKVVERRLRQILRIGVGGCNHTLGRSIQKLISRDILDIRHIELTHHIGQYLRCTTEVEVASGTLDILSLRPHDGKTQRHNNYYTTHHKSHFTLYPHSDVYPCSTQAGRPHAPPSDAVPRAPHHHRRYARQSRPRT